LRHNEHSTESDQSSDVSGNRHSWHLIEWAEWETMGLSAEDWRLGGGGGERLTR